MPFAHPAESPADRDRRQMALCARLADAATRLAELAAAAAVAEYTAGTANKNGPNHTERFIRLSHAVRQAILLENRIASQPRPQTQLLRPSPSPRTGPAPIQIRALSGPRLEYERLDTSLALNPHSTPDEILKTLCKTVGLSPDDEDPPATPAAESPPFVFGTSPEPTLLARIGLDTARRT